MSLESMSKIEAMTFGYDVDRQFGAVFLSRVQDNLSLVWPVERVSRGFPHKLALSRHMGLSVTEL